MVNSTTKKIWVGKPKVYYKTSEVTGFYADFSLESSVSEARLEDQGITNITCDKTIFRGNGNISFNCERGSMTAADNNWSVRRETLVTNICGTNTIIFDFIPPYENCDKYHITYGQKQDFYKITKPCTPGAIYSDNTNIVFDKESVNIQIMNATGNIVINTTNQQFSLAHLLPGTYYARIIKNGKIVHTQTLLKR